MPALQCSGVDLVDTVGAGRANLASERISAVSVCGDCHAVETARRGAFQEQWLLPFRRGNVKSLNLRGLNVRITFASP